jgi:hypothetical protein
MIGRDSMAAAHSRRRGGKWMQRSLRSLHPDYGVATADFHALRRQNSALSNGIVSAHGRV